MKYSKREIIVDLIVVNLLCGCVYYFILIVQQAIRKEKATNGSHSQPVKDTALTIKSINDTAYQKY